MCNCNMSNFLPDVFLFSTPRALIKGYTLGVAPDAGRAVRPVAPVSRAVPHYRVVPLGADRAAFRLTMVGPPVCFEPEPDESLVRTASFGSSHRRVASNVLAPDRHRFVRATVVLRANGIDRRGATSCACG